MHGKYTGPGLIKKASARLKDSENRAERLSVGPVGGGEARLPV